MRTPIILRVALAAASLLACASEATPRADGCPAGFALTYTIGCSATPTCRPDTSGDAIAIVFCGCDGQTHYTSQWPPTRPWVSQGPCASDGGTDGGLSCTRPPAQVAGCNTDDDCASVPRGCYCGARPVVGVARVYAAYATLCEGEAASTCRLGCAVSPGRVAEDGTVLDDGGVVSVRCEHGDAALGACRTYVRR